MICPQCRAEFRPGFSRCADCDVPLVDAATHLETAKMADMLEPDASHEPVQVMATQDLSLIPVLQSLLDGAQIPYEVRGDQNFSLQPAFDLLTGREKTPILILVPADRAEEARALLEAPDASILDD